MEQSTRSSGPVSNIITQVCKKLNILQPCLLYLHLSLNQADLSWKLTEVLGKQLLFQQDQVEWSPVVLYKTTTLDNMSCSAYLRPAGTRQQYFLPLWAYKKRSYLLINYAIHQNARHSACITSFKSHNHHKRRELLLSSLQIRKLSSKGLR